ncbi:MAG: nickel pincer cofactor biosynthesis protein LarB [Gammaproteobacteria bacterium]|nr:nickel pincer cofactor biosynthesis protein LarB [Gammaproteobacteria bacterium]
MTGVDDILDRFAAGAIDRAEAAAALNSAYFENLGHSTIDHDRARRTGSPEVIYGEHKTPAQVAATFKAVADRGHNALATRVSQAAADAAIDAVPGAMHHPEARLVTFKQQAPDPVETQVAVVTAGTSDLAVAEEAALTAEFYDSPVLRISDVGVAGVHRLLARVDEIRGTKVVVVVAGMEGALPSVVGGLIDKPVIAVPTSVGYGASFNGVAALLGMLNSCASGVSVVNIDNGFGAGYLANMINRL